jgi:hypothetical protein
MSCNCCIDSSWIQFIGKVLIEETTRYLRDLGYELYAGHNLFEHDCKQVDSIIKTTRPRKVLFMSK